MAIFRQLAQVAVAEAFSFQCGSDITSIAMAVPEHIPSSLPVGKRWGVAATASACLCVTWFAYLNRDGCWFYLRGTRGLTVFVSPWLWLLLMFGFRMKGRLVLFVLTLFGLLFWPHVDTFRFAAAESSAVATPGLPLQACNPV